MVRSDVASIWQRYPPVEAYICAYHLIKSVVERDNSCRLNNPPN